jgi:hypothetical protein
MKYATEAVNFQRILIFQFCFLFCVFALGAPAFATDWETFQPPSKEYSISLPVGISRVAKEDGMDAVMYSSSDSDINFLIDDGTEVNPVDQKSKDQFVLGVTDGMMEKLKSEGVKNAQTSEEKVKGKGWHGTKTTVKINGKKAMTVVVAFANNDDVAYTCMATAGDDNPKVANFFDSLVVDPSIASEAHKTNSVAYKNGRALGRKYGPILIPAVLFTLFFGVVVLVIFLVKRNMKDR